MPEPKTKTEEERIETDYRPQGWPPEALELLRRIAKAVESIDAELESIRYGRPRRDLE